MRLFRRSSPYRSPRLTWGRLIATLLLAGLCAVGYTTLRLTLTQRPGLVIEVADGDTVVVLSEEGEPVRVRLFGIDAPEYRQAAGKASAAFARRMLLGKQVTLALADRDKYGRTVAVILLPDGANANEAMIRAGHAWVYRQYCREYFCAAWLYHEYRAREGRLGLWSQANPQPPWEWRHRNPKR